MNLATLALVSAIASVIAPAQASPPSIFMASNPDGTGCELSAPPGTSFTFYVFARQAGMAADGITGAQFRVSGMPTGAGWSFTFVPNPAAHTTFGNPFGSGVFITFPACQPGESGVVVLGTVNGHNFGDPRGYALRAGHVIPFPWPNFPCILVSLCDANFTYVCALSEPFLLNATTAIVTPPTGSPANGATGVSTDVDLFWSTDTIEACNQDFVPVYVLRFASDPSPPVVWSGTETTHNPGPLLPNTQYYWNVTVCYGGVCAASPLWSFRTDETVANHRIEWTGVKCLFR